MGQTSVGLLLTACATVAALGVLLTTGTLLLPAEWRRMRRFAEPPSSDRALRTTARWLDMARGGPLRTMAALFDERDATLLAAAGLAAPQAAAFRALRPVLPVVAALASALLAFGQPRLPWLLLTLVGAAALGPEGWLRFLAGRRRSRIAREFPEFVDLLVISAAGGGSLTDALRFAIGDDRTAFADELRAALREAAAGTPLAAALRQVARRVGLPSVSAFIASLCETESLGVPLADSLAVQAESARTSYRQLLEGRVNQLPLQMTICALVFLFPMAFIVVALPNIIAFTSTMR